LNERAIEHAVLPWSEANGVAVTAYSPLGQNEFPAPGSPGGRVLARIAAARGATSRQVALAFLTRRPAVFAIPKASTTQHVAENAAAADLRLLPADIADIDAAFPLGRRPRSLPML
jgi:diketogulonate reductase-like aldo/keto reductase